MIRAWFFPALVLLSACAGFAERQQQYELSSDRADDEYCVKQGLHYPDHDYVDCRRSLQNARLYRQWKSHQMVQAGANPAHPSAPGPAAVFEPLDAQHFQCHIDTGYGGDTVTCRAVPSTPPR